MANRADFIFDLISDVWDGYQERDQIASLWEGYLEIGSDLVLQLFQANLSKSIRDIPVFRRFRWLNYDLSRTVVPSEFQCPFVFAYSSGDENILSAPYLSDRVRCVDDDEFLQLTNSSSGAIIGNNCLQDVVNLFPADLRVGDYVRFISGTGLAVEDTEVRFSVARINSPTSIELSVNNLTSASSIRYVIERSPLLRMVEGTHYVIQDGVVNFLPAPVLAPDGPETEFQVVQDFSYQGDFLRDDPRLVANGGNALLNVIGDSVLVTGGTLVLNGTTLVEADPGVNFITSGVVVGDYLVVRPSGSLPGQPLTSTLVRKIIAVISATSLEFEGASPVNSSFVSYDIIRVSAEDFDLISTEAGTVEFPYSYAFSVTGALAPSSTAGSLVGDVLTDVSGVDFTNAQAAPNDTVLVGKKLRVLSGTGLVASELAEFTVIAVLGPTQVQLNRSVVSPSTVANAVYIVGDLLLIDQASPASDPSQLILSDELQFSSGSSNSTLVTDGTLAFSTGNVTTTQPYLRFLRARRATSPSNEEVVWRLWAEETVVDQDQLFKNFGFPIQVNQENSQEYKNVLQGLWFAYWNGPTLDNIVRGLNLVFDLPFAPRDGVVSSISLPDPAFLEGTVASSVNVPINTFDVSATNPLGDSRFLAFSLDDQPPILVIFTDSGPGLAQLPNTEVRDQINLAVGSPVASLTPDGRIRLSALTSVKIDTVIGNPGVGLAPGDEDFGVYNLILLGDGGSSELLEFGTQFPISVEVGERVEQFQQLTDAVGVFDYVSLPEWWNIFGITSINSSLTSFSLEDRDILNDIMKDFTFAVRVVSDAFTRLGPVDRAIVRFFLEQIKPTISDYLFIVAERFSDIVSMTDSRILLGQPVDTDGYLPQYTNQDAFVNLTIGLQLYRDIAWNFANYYQLTPAERAAFEVAYHMAQYDDLRLDTDDMTITDSVQITIS